MASQAELTIGWELGFLAPSYEDRLLSSAAAAAFHAIVLRHLDQNGRARMPKCTCCGAGAGDWCNACELAGRRDSLGHFPGRCNRCTTADERGRLCNTRPSEGPPEARCQKFSAPSTGERKRRQGRRRPDLTMRGGHPTASGAARPRAGSSESRPRPRGMRAYALWRTTRGRRTALGRQQHAPARWYDPSPGFTR